MSVRPRSGSPGSGSGSVVGSTRLAAGTLALALFSLATVACATTPAVQGVTDGGGRARQLAYRIRADGHAPLNQDVGWAAGLNQIATVDADQPFRLRFELETGVGDAVAAGGGYRLQVRRNGGQWESVEAADFPYPDEIASPPVSIVEPLAYSPGEATTDLLRASELPFRGGIGVGLDSVARADISGAGHAEWEWSLVIRRFADGAVMNEEGDTFEFRMTDGSGVPLQGGPLPRVTLNVPPRLLGGTYVETPGRLGPWQAANGALYFVMEPAETDNVLMVVRSADGGDSWREVDGANRPATDDLEGLATVLHDGTIHLLHQTSDFVHYHAFGTADHPTRPDRWLVRDELVTSPSEPPTQVAALEALGDGNLVAVYGDSVGLRFRLRSPGGEWAPERRVDGPAGFVLSGPQLVAGDDDVVHLAYTARSASAGHAWLRTISADGTLGPARLVAEGLGTAEEDAGSILPLVRLASNTVVVLYRTADGVLWERRFDAEGTLSVAVQVTNRRVVQSAVDSDQVGADAIAVGETVNVLFIDEASGDLFQVTRRGGEGWSSAIPAVEGIDAQWVRGNRIRRADGSHVYGFVYDAGSDGGSGMNRYGEVELE